MRYDTVASGEAVSVRPAPPRFKVRWASCEEDVRDAQRLRYRVFAQELGARISPPGGTAPGLDADSFDPFCDHLLVSVCNTDHPYREPGELLVGTYRVLTPDAARRAGGLYIDTEFDLAPLASVRRQALELGRACVHPDWRSGAVVMALWTAVVQYALARKLDTMIGCVSVSLSDGGQCASELWGRLKETHLVAPQWQVTPRIAWVQAANGAAGGAASRPVQAMPAPPLIKGYLRCGARLLGAPALDPAFNTADLPMILRTGDMSPRFRHHFMGA